MGDIPLREAERNYLESGAEVDLDIYNAARRRVGLELIRPENYLVHWAYKIAQMMPLEDREFDLDDEEDFLPFTQTLERRGIRFNFTLRQPHRNSLQLRFDAPRVLANIRFNLNGSDIHISEAVAIHSDSTDVIMGTEQREEINNFINADELLEHCINVATKVFISYLDAFESRMRDNETWYNSIIVNYYNNALIHLLDSPETSGRWQRLCQKLAACKKFKQELNVFASSIEQYLEHAGLHFDNEGGWPISITHGRSITLTPGYCDQIAEELEEGEEPDSNTQGSNRGYAYDIADKMAEFLEEYDEIHGIPCEEDCWSVDYELDEYYVDEDYPSEGELCFSLPISRELTPLLLGFILAGACDRCTSDRRAPHRQAT